MILAVILVAIALGGLIETERVSTRRTDYLALAERADRVEQGCRRQANNSMSQAAEIRQWVATGAQGMPPGGPGESDENPQPPRRAYTLGPKEADRWRSNPELALAFAARLEQEAPGLYTRADELARRRTHYQRRASYPRVFFAAAAPSREQDTKEGGYFPGQ
jgi:hypothetical protein